MITSTTSLSLDSGRTLVGRSRAGEGTCFCIPELKWMFDAGAIVTMNQPQTLFITHTHTDHVQCLCRLIVQSMSRNSAEHPLKIFVPKVAAPLIERHIQTYLELIECNDTQYREHNQTSLHYSLVGMEANQRISFRGKGENEFEVSALICNHRILCFGYCLSRIKKRLKEQYVGVPHTEINALQKQNFEVTESISEPFLCVLGDTTHTVFESYPHLPKQYRIIVVECSFIAKQDKPRAVETTHMHWDDLQPIVCAHPKTLFVLTHFSLKYTSLELRRFFVSMQKKHNICNVHPMLIQEEVEAAWQNNKSQEENAVPTCQCMRCCA
jgi:ribonuclease Z